MIYQYRYTRKSIKDDKDFYFCHGNQACPQCLYILRHSDSLKASIWLSGISHQHKAKKPSVLPPKSLLVLKNLLKRRPDSLIIKLLLKVKAS